MNEEQRSSHEERPSVWLLLFPVFVLLLAFLLDKAFFIGRIEDYFLTTASFLNFDHKVVMLDELDEHLKKPDHPKTLVLFGNSRTLAFSRDYIEEHYPGWTLFNFSVPGGTTDYFYYFMKEFRRRNIRPEAIYFAVTPQGMNASPAVALDEVMVFGLPPSFLIDEFRHYSVDELTNYLARKTFLVYRYRPKLKTILFRMSYNEQTKDRPVDAFRRMLDQTRQSLQRHRGSVPFDLDVKPPQDEESIQANALSIWKDSFTPFQLHAGQVYFTEESLKIAQELGSKTGLLWPRVSAPLRHFKNTDKVAVNPVTHEPATVREVWEPVMQGLARTYKASWLDFNYDARLDLHCELFFDASHMASGCFRPFMDAVMTEVLK
jgi:hypothetical protein